MSERFPGKIVWPNGNDPADPPYITSKWGYREPFETPGGTTSSFHSGTDMIGFTNNLAVCDGIAYTSWNGGYGNQVMLYAADGWRFRYGHNERFLVKNGQQVKLGEPLGVMGTTGRSTGIHLHLEVLPPDGGKMYGTIDPELFYEMQAGLDPNNPKWDEMATKAEIAEVVRDEVRKALLISPTDPYWSGLVNGTIEKGRWMKGKRNMWDMLNMLSDNQGVIVKMLQSIGGKK